MVRDVDNSGGVYVANSSTANSSLPNTFVQNDNGFSSGLGKSEQLDVSVEHLDNVQAWCKDISTAIQNEFLPNLDFVHRLVKMSTGTGSRSSLGSSEIEGVQDLTTQLEQAYSAVQQSMKSIATNLDQTGTAIKNIADKYHSVEERNKANAADLGTASAG
jgi:hypothetical protein